MEIDKIRDFESGKRAAVNSQRIKLLRKITITFTTVIRSIIIFANRYIIENDCKTRICDDLNRRPFVRNSLTLSISQKWYNPSQHVNHRPISLIKPRQSLQFPVPCKFELPHLSSRREKGTAWERESIGEKSFEILLQRRWKFDGDVTGNPLPALFSKSTPTPIGRGGEERDES